MPDVVDYLSFFTGLRFYLARLLILLMGFSLTGYRSMRFLLLVPLIATESGQGSYRYGAPGNTSQMVPLVKSSRLQK